MPHPLVREVEGGQQTEKDAQDLGPIENLFVLGLMSLHYPRDTVTEHKVLSL